VPAQTDPSLVAHTFHPKEPLHSVIGLCGLFDLALVL
jgi:hypothetical protein